MSGAPTIVEQARALLALRWSEVVHDPDEGLYEVGPGKGAASYEGIADQLEAEAAKASGWCGDEESAGAWVAVPLRRLRLAAEAEGADGGPEEYLRRVDEGYPHVRDVLAGLLAEVERLQAQLGSATIPHGARP